MQREFRNVIWTALAIGALSCGAFAELSRPTLSGTLVGINAGTGMVSLRLESGKVVRAHMDKKARYKLGDRNAGPGSFSPGMRVAVRIEGAINESPLQCDMLMDWMTSEKYVAHVAEAPYITPKGDYPSTSGVAGKAEGGPDLVKMDKQLGVLANGGKVDGFEKDSGEDMNKKLGKSLGVKAMGDKPAGYYEDSTMPANQGSKMAAASNLANDNRPIPGTPGGASPMIQPGMTAQQQIQMQQYQLAQQRAQMMGGASVGSMLDPEEGSGAGVMGGGGPAGMPGGNPMAMGFQVSITAQVVSSDMASRTVMVRAANSQAVQTVILNAQVPMPPLQPGQTVAIQGTSDPQGLIQATSLMIVGH